MSSINQLSDKEKSNKKGLNKNLKDFGILFSIVFLLLGTFKVYNNSRFGLILFFLSILSLALAYLKPTLLFWPEKLWMKFGDFMSSIMTRVMVFLIFALAITPIALIMRALGKRPLKLSFDKNLDSYWEKFDESGPCSRPYLPY